MKKAEHDGIIVLGCPRSGTTLLRRLLGAHPNIAAPGETYLLSAAARFLEGETMVDGMEVGVLNGLGFIGFDAEAITARLREFVFGFHREHAAREEKRRWLEKTAVDAFHVKSIERFCGNYANFICVTRHGLDVVCSMQDWCAKSEAYPAEIHRYIQRTPRPYEAFSHAWADTTEAISAFARAHPTNTISIRYEDLVADPESELRGILNFIGEDFDEAAFADALSTDDLKGFSDWKSFAKASVDSSSVGRWKTSLSPETSGALAPIVNPMLAEHGYDETPFLAPRSNAEKRRRYELGLMLQKLR